MSFETMGSFNRMSFGVSTHRIFPSLVTAFLALILDVVIESSEAFRPSFSQSLALLTLPFAFVFEVSASRIEAVSSSNYSLIFTTRKKIDANRKTA
jgi:hypothetical protein